MMEEFGYADNLIKVNNVTVSRKAGLWFISISCQIADPVCESQGAGTVGVDLGVKSLAVCSDGTVIGNPKNLRRRERRKKHLQRAVSRKRKGSQNWLEAKRRLARYEYHTVCKRRDWVHKATRLIADRNAPCFMEDLNVGGMMKNHRLAKAVSDCGFYEFKRQLAYKTRVCEIDRWCPSSQLCSNCGARKPMPLSERTYRCDQCGTVLDRDMNAALNILHVGIANYPELMPVEGDNHREPTVLDDCGTALYETGIDHQTLNRFE